MKKISWYLLGDGFTSQRLALTLLLLTSTFLKNTGVRHTACIRFAKIRNDSSDPSDSTMKKTPRVRHSFHSRKIEEYNLALDKSYSRSFFHSRVTPRVTRITRIVPNLCESNTTTMTKTLLWDLKGTKHMPNQLYLYCFF